MLNVMEVCPAFRKTREFSLDFNRLNELSGVVLLAVPPVLCAATAACSSCLCRLRSMNVLSPLVARFRSVAVLLLVVITSMAASSPAAAQQLTGPDLFPQSTAICLEVTDPPALLASLVRHPLVDQLQGIEGIRKALSGPEIQPLLTGRNFFQLQMGMPWLEALQAISAQGLWIAVDSRDQSAALLIHGRDEQLMQDVRLKLLELTRLTPGGNGKLDTYRDIPVYRLPQGGAAVVGQWLLVVNKNEAGRRLLDRLLDLQSADDQSLSALPAWQQARAARQPQSAAWLWAGMQAIRETAGHRAVFRDQAENPLVELLFGGLQTVLNRTDWLQAELQVADSSLRLALTAPFSADWIPETRQWYFGPEAAGQVPAVPRVAGLLGSVGMYRNVSEMWQRAGDLFDADINDRMAEAESNLGTIFGGRDFGDEVLGAFGPQLLLVAARQDFSSVQTVPAIRLPAFALVLQLKDAETMRPELRRAFQSAIGFFNITGIQEGRPQLDMDMQKSADTELIISRYLPPRKPGTGEAPPVPLIYNFSPTAAFRKDQFVLASTEQLAAEILQAPRQAPVAANMAMHVQADIAGQLVADNQQSLVSQNMLTKGQTREEAEAEVAVLQQLIGLMRGMTFQLRPDPAANQLQLELDLQLTPASQPNGVTEESGRGN
jgi:hypothetical protein